MRKRKTTTTIETHEILTIRRPALNGTPCCTICLERIPMLTLEEAALQTGIKQVSLSNSLQAGRFHSTEMTDGRVFVCLASVVARK